MTSLHEALNQTTADVLIDNLNQPNPNNSFAIGFSNGFDTTKDTLFLLTATFKRNDWRADRRGYFGRHIAQIKLQEQDNEFHCVETTKCRQIVWVIVEDSSEIDTELLSLLKCSKINFVYFAYGPTKSFGNSQKNAMMQYVVELTRAFNFHGIMHPLDDDGYALAQGFHLCYNVKKFALLPIVGLGHIHDGLMEFVAEEDGKKKIHAYGGRKYPMDFNAMVFHSSIFDKLGKSATRFWPHDAWGGESEFADTHLRSPQDIEILCNKCMILFYNAKILPQHPIYEC
ncbi:hypothetical protein BCR33DRAFT_780633 [Rhizoclosmatium globosum]|uniref:Uncharacterized protein n=1 Tax=Rhizoclosmatium globosum TaxID=329046 RepID=A0A1Y2CUI1_9FUNG|nr:hypothetical protein BCR33DRAFT_780633 [Rhizoclosmatium globosum]|eukprot:ORY50699.1 hypothetical protein BCR33DRAFT_780633 [Rhizoclosmatium globosum]